MKDMRRKNCKLFKAQFETRKMREEENIDDGPKEVLLMEIEEVLKNENSKYIEMDEIDFVGDLINSLEELKKSRKKNKHIQEKIPKHEE